MSQQGPKKYAFLWCHRWHQIAQSGSLNMDPSIRESPAKLNMWSCPDKFGWRNSEHASLTCSLPRFVISSQQSLIAAGEECNKSDVTSTPCFWLANHNYWSRWFAISSLPPICSPSFSFMGEVGNKYITKLRSENLFSWADTEPC